MLPKLFGKYGSAKSLVGARSMQALRGTGRGIRGIARLPGRVAGAAAGAVLQSSGFAPLVSAASNVGRGLFSSSRGGRSRGGSSKKETGLLNTSLLFQIRDEVQQIKGLLVTQQIPESERREREFEDWRRHRELLLAISSLSPRPGTGSGGEKDGGSLAKLLLGLLALTGLAMLPKLLENIPSIVDGIQSFLDKMGLFLLGMWGVFKLLGTRAKAMKPPKPVKTPRIPRTITRKTPAQLKADHMKKVDKQNARKAAADAKKAKAEERRRAREKGRHRPILRRMFGGGGSSALEKVDKPRRTPKGGIGSRVGALFADTETRGKDRAVTEAKQAAEREQKARNAAANKRALIERSKGNLQILQAEKAQLLEERRASEKKRQGFDEDRRRARAKIVARLAISQALKDHRAGKTPDTSRQNLRAKAEFMKSEAFRRETINRINFTLGKWGGDIYRGLKTLNVSTAQVFNITRLALADNERMPKIKSMGAKVGAGIVKVASATARGFGGLMGPNQGAGVSSGTVTQQGLQKPMQYSFGNKGPTMGGGGITTTPTPAAGENALKALYEKMAKWINGVGGKFKKFASTFWGHLKSGAQSMAKMGNIPGIRLLGRIAVIGTLIIQIGALIIRYMYQPQSFKGKTDEERRNSFLWEVGKVLYELAKIIALFVAVGVAVSAALSAALPALAGGVILGVLGGIASIFISGWIMSLLDTEDPNKTMAALGDPYEWWKAQTERVSNVGVGMFQEAMDEKDVLKGIASLTIQGAAAAMFAGEQMHRFFTKDYGVSDAVRKVLFNDSNFVQASTAGGGGASDSGIHPTALGNEKLRILMKKAEAKLTDDVKKIVPEVLPSYVLGATMATGDSLSPGSAPGMRDGSKIHTSGLDHERLRYLMAQYKSSPEVVVISNTSVTDASSKSFNSSNTTALNSNQGSNVSITGKGLYE